MADPTVSELVVQRESIKSQIARLGDLRPGSLVDRLRRCGKPNCRCANIGQVGHGPSWSLTHGEKGKTVTFVIPADRSRRLSNRSRNASGWMKSNTFGGKVESNALFRIAPTSICSHE